MKTVRIYKYSKTAMQSGQKKTQRWCVQYETADPLTTEPLMGWVEAYDMLQELKLSFDSLSEALHFATTQGLSYTICNPPKTYLVPKSYAANFV